MSDKKSPVDDALKSGQEWIKKPENQAQVKGWIVTFWSWITKKK
jgi:hypothetical protein